MRPIRTLLLTTVMAPYRIPVFNVLAAREEVCLRVLYLAETAPHRAWPRYVSEMQYDFRVLRQLFQFKWHETWVHVSHGLFRELRVWRPDVVIAGGWDQPSYLVAYALRRLFGYAFACWAESTARDFRAESDMAERIKRRVVSGSDVVIVPGSASRRYVMMLGASAEDVVVAPNAVDSDFFASRGCVNRGLRTGPCRFLYVGRMHPSKGIDVLLRAWQRLPEGHGTLVLVGDGSLRREIQRSVESKVLQGVELRGHLDRENLAEEYALADVFVLPSLSDPWGLVINEAMAAGLPIITTSAPGAVDDLVEHGANGMVVTPGDADALRLAMEELGNDRGLQLRMGKTSWQRIQNFSPEACAGGFVAAVRVSGGQRHG